MKTFHFFLLLRLIGSRDGKLLSINKDTGIKKWIFKTGSSIESSPIIVNDKIICCTDDGIIYMIDREKGKKIWAYETGSSFTCTPIIVKGKLIVASNDGIIYTFGEDNE